MINWIKDYIMKWNCEEEHFKFKNENGKWESEEFCILCSHENYGGNKKRYLCKILGHDWQGVYSWWMYCYRCNMNRHPKGFTMTPLGDGYIIG